MRSIFIDGWLRRLSIPDKIKIDHYYNLNNKRDEITLLAKNQKNEDLIVSFRIDKVRNEFEFKKAMRNVFNKMLFYMEGKNDTN